MNITQYGQNDHYTHSECTKSKLEKDDYDDLNCIFEKKHDMFSDITDIISNNIVFCSKERALHFERNNIVCDLEQNILDGSKWRLS